MLLDAFDRRGSALLACMHACALLQRMTACHVAQPRKLRANAPTASVLHKGPDTQAKHAVALENSTDCTLLSMFGQMRTNARQRALACEHERLPGLAAPRCAD